MLTFILGSFIVNGVKEKNKPIGMYCYLAILAHILDR